MSTPAAKRRRIDTASQTLSKPFRSPFKTPFKSPVKSTVAAEAQSQTRDGSSLSSTSASSSATPPATRNATPLAAKSANTLLNRAPTSKLALGPTTPRPTSFAGSIGGEKKKVFSSPAATRKINADPEVARLAREQRELERGLREVRDELDAAEQAGKIERDSERWALRKREEEGLGKADEEVVEVEIDGELRELVVKWRGASRLAAEELFGRVRDRVNRMGGPRAWKEAQQQQKEFQDSWNQEDQPKIDGDDDDDDDDRSNEHADVEKRDLYAEYSVDPETENEKSQRANGVGDTGEMPGQEDEFTMAMMLRTLNVDLDVIGYDREQQRWAD